MHRAKEETEGVLKRGEKKVKRVRTRRTEEEKTHFQVMLGWGRRIWGR